MSEQPDHGTPERTASHPHDKYFRSVFSNPEDAASLLRAYVPQSLGRTLKWATLTMLPGRFVSADWRGSEADLLFSVEREATDTPVLLYVLLEHQSSPDRWMRLRLLNYCVQVWLQWRSTHERELRLPLIVPLVFYQGAGPWPHDGELAELFGSAPLEWRWVPRFHHLLIEQTRQDAESARGAPVARLAQIAIRARHAARRASGGVRRGVAPQRAESWRRRDELRGATDRARTPGG